MQMHRPENSMPYVRFADVMDYSLLWMKYLLDFIEPEPYSPREQANIILICFVYRKH